MIQGIINTLNTIEVRGKDNLDKLLGCILLLENIQQKINNNSEKDSDADRVEKDGELNG